MMLKPVLMQISLAIRTAIPGAKACPLDEDNLPDVDNEFLTLEDALKYVSEEGDPIAIYTATDIIYQYYGNKSLETYTPIDYFHLLIMEELVS